MVFESIVADVLNRFVGEYVENLDKKQLKIGIWGGDVVLNNLVLKQSALKELDLPVSALYGHLGKLVLKIPWKNLYSAPVEAIVDKLYILAVPNTDIKYNDEKEDKAAFEAKKAELLRIEQAKKNEEEKETKTTADKTFAEKLTAQIVNNVQIKISDIHIRYEDTTTTGFPFAFGVTLSNLSVHTTDENWMQTLVSESVTKIYKVAQMEMLSVYMNCNTKLFQNAPQENYLRLFEENIASKTKQPSNYHYIFGPISSGARLVMTPNPETGDAPFSTPKIKLSLKMETLSIGITRIQYQNLMQAVEAMGRLMRAMPYRKYRPYGAYYRGNYKLWWQFAYTCIVETVIRRRKENWSWEHMLAHRKYLKLYEEYYRQKLTTKKITPEINEKCDELEKILDLHNLVIVRQKVELEVEKQGKLKEAEPKQGWLSSWWSGSKKTDEEEKQADLKKQFEAAMTPQEKAKLFKAIGYQENSVPTELPENYVAQCFEFDLSSLKISIKSEIAGGSPNISSKTPLETILLLQLKNVGCKFQQRPSAPAIKLNLRLQELSVQGVKQGEILPIMVYSQLDSSNTLLEVMFETNPIDKLCDQRVVLGSRPIQIVYDAETIIQLAKVFQTPQSATISQLTDAAAEKLVTIKERSAVGLQYAISKHPRLELNISLMPTYIIVPHSGLFTKNASVLVLSLGSLLMQTEPRPLDQKDVRTMFEEGASQEEILEEMIRQSLELRDVQGIVATYDEDWRNNLDANIVTSMHILEPTSFKIQAHLSVLSDDPRLPKCKIFGELPSINVAVTEQRVFEVLKIVTSIPFPESEEFQPAPMNKETNIFNSSLSLITKYLDDKQKESSKQIASSETLRLDDTVDEVVQFTDLEIHFVLNECSLTIFKAACTNTSSTDTFATPTGEMAESPLDAELMQKTVAFDVPYFVSSQTKILACHVRQLEMIVVQRTYDLKVALKLGAVMLDQFRIKNEKEKVLNVINTPKYVDNDEFLFTVDYTNCKKNSPEFATKYESVEQEVSIKFSTIVLTLNEESINELITLANDFQNKMEMIVNAKPRDRVATIHEEETKTKQILTAAKEKLPTILEDGPIVLSKEDTKKQTSIVDSIKIRVHAIMEDVTVELQNAKRPIGVLEVQNLDCSAIMKTSYTEINMKLQDIVLQDKNPASIHRNILTIIGDNAIKVQVVLYNLEATSDYNSDNMKIDVEMGCAKIVFMNWFVTSVLDFLDNFQAAQQKIKDAGVAVAEAAKQNVVEAYTQATRMRLCVSLNAPIIIIPVDSQSLQAIAMDFGHLTISNRIKDVPTSHENNTAVIDKMKVELKDMKLSKVNVFTSVENIGDETIKRIGSEDMMYGLIPDSNILNPTSFTLSISRNLSSSWYKDEPEMDISGRLNAVEVNCITSDYSVILQILSKNMAEGQSEAKKTVKVDKPAMSPVQDLLIVDDAKESWISAAKKVSVKPFGIELGQIKDKNDQIEKAKEHVSTFLRFSFQIDSIKLKIFTSPGNGLASFGIYFLSLKGQKLSDGSLSTSVALCDVLIDDTRTGRENKLTRMMERRGGESFDESDSSFIPASTMVDITLSMMGNDITTEMKISSFNLILSLDFIMKVLEFLQPAELQEQQAKAEIVASENIRSRKSSTSIAAQPVEKSTIKVRLKIEQPDIILVERMDDENCYALVLNNEIDLKVRILPEKMLIDGELRELCLYYCEFNPARRNLTKHYVIHPCHLSLFGSTPEGKGLFMNLKSTEINMSVSPAILELINNVLATLQTKETTVLEEDKKIVDYSDLWQVQEFDENDFWFIKAEVAEDATNLEETLSIASLSKIDVKEEKCIIEIPKISLIIETGTGMNTIPMLYIETKFDASVDNWSSKLAISSTLCLNMSYYNQTLALWEYMIEPNVMERLDGQIEYSPWELQFVMYIDNHEEDPSKEPTTVINVKSKEILEMTVTKRCLDVLQTLGNAFSVAMKREGIAASESVAPYIVRNDTGLDIKVDFFYSDFNIHSSHIEERKSDDLVAIENTSDGAIHSCLILPGGKLNLEPKVKDTGVILPASLDDERNVKKKFLKVVIGDTEKEIFLPVYKSDRRYFPIFRNTNQEAWAIISEVRIETGSTIVTIRGIVQVYNHFTMPIYVHQKANDEFDYVGEVKPGSYLNVPLLYTYAPIKELHFAMNGYYASSQGIGWKEQPNNMELIKLLQCYPVKTYEPFYINAVRERHEVYYEVTTKYTMMSACYEIHLKPPLSLRNALPIGLTLSVAGCSVSREPIATSVESISNTSTIIGEDYLDYGEKLLRPGELLHLPTVKTAGSTKTGENPSYVVARLVDYLEKDWSCTTEIPSSPPEFQVWTFNAYDSVEQMSLQLGVRYENQSDGLMLTIYCPFWMINKTGMMLSYRANDENTNILYHPPDYEGPILFSFREKAFFGKKKAAVRVDAGEWSEKFSLDVAGSSGVVSCEANDMIYQIGIQNTLTNNSLTKQIVFMPYFILINRAEFDIEVQEDQRPADPWSKVKTNDCISLWPKTAENRMLKVKSCDSAEVTAPFKYTEVQCTLLQLKNKYGGINVDVHVTEGAIYVTFMGYYPGDAPALIINHTDEDFSFWEKGNVNSRSTENTHLPECLKCLCCCKMDQTQHISFSVNNVNDEQEMFQDERILRPKQKMLYTWLNPAGDRAIMWNNGPKETVENDLRRDGINQISSFDSGKEIFWVSFLNGTQRVLLLTNDESIANSVQSANQLDNITQEIMLEIHGVGLSLVNNLKQFDLMYIGIASSGVIWEECKKSGRFKQMKIQETFDMEKLYQQYMANTKVNHARKYFLESEKLEVDFDEMIIKKSTNRKIRRAFYPGFWIEMKSSSHQMQFHAKINRIQIDNQLTDCIFPVVLAPIPPPKSVAATTEFKPFIEMSVVQRIIPHSNVKQFKYLRMLIQEFHIKVDLPFVNEIFEMISSETTEAEAKKLFAQDLELQKQPLFAHVTVQSQQEVKHFYDNLHLGPLKIHVSFSMAGSESKALPAILSTILQGVGVTLTDINDVVFRLAFFERDYQFLTQRQLVSECVSHYVGQAVKQLYVLVLGLDVIGNPYGLVIGFTTGVGDLFYEPFQGAIQGPGEFAEGLVLGVRSLFGHTVGGAAGAVSKITGAMGKGLAALTFDKDYQKKRRDAMNKKPANLQEGIARSGKGLVMGVYDGFTGVITKPISGAKHEGVGGFFKGLGKGAVGLVARPTAGIVDFASGTFDSVKRATELSDETTRLRPPRLLHSDGILRPYNRKEAEGCKMLREIDKGKFAATDTFVYFEVLLASKDILVLTNYRIIYGVKNELFGGWQTEWTYKWDEVDQVRLHGAGVELIMKSEPGKNKFMKMFGQSDVNRKIILVDIEERRPRLVEIMNNLRVKAG